MRQTDTGGESARAPRVDSPSRRCPALRAAVAGMVSLGCLCLGCTAQDTYRDPQRSTTDAPAPAGDGEREAHARLEQLAATSPELGFASSFLEAASALTRAFATTAANEGEVYPKLQVQSQYLMKAQAALNPYLNAPDDKLKQLAVGLNEIAETHIKANETFSSIIRGDRAVADVAAVRQVVEGIDRTKREALTRLDGLMRKAVDVISGLSLSENQRQLLVSDIDRLFGSDIKGDQFHPSAILPAVRQIKQNLAKPGRQ